MKTRSSKSRNIDIFPKRLTHGFGPKMAIFAKFFFLAIQAKKMSFTIFQIEKTLFQAIKIRSSKSRKIDIFPKVLTHGFGPKMANFSTFFFTQYRPVKCLLRYSRAKKSFPRLYKKEVLIVEKVSLFSKGLTHGFGPKMAIFSTFFFRQYRPGKCLLQ